MEVPIAQPSFLLLATIGLAAGVLSGLFGIGGGVLIVPALIYIIGFDQRLATGTSLVVLLPPVGVGAAIEYFRHGNVDLRAGIVIAVMLLVGGWIGATLAHRITASYLRVWFGLFVLVLGALLTWNAIQQVGTSIGQQQ